MVGGVGDARATDTAGGTVFGLTAEQVSSELLRLELDGRVAALPGGLYQRLEKEGRR